jgi:hypothetical protein
VLDMSTTTVAQLRPVLAGYFARHTIDNALRKVRKQGLIEPGRAGKNGVNSAHLGIEQVVAVVLALACRAAKFKPGAGWSELRLARKPGPVPAGEPGIFLSPLIEDIERAGERPPGTWQVRGYAKPGSAVTIVCELPSSLLAEIGQLFAARAEAAA